MEIEKVFQDMKAAVEKGAGDVWATLQSALEEARSKNNTLGSKASSDAEPVGDIALIGMAVMGQNLILNMADHGYKVVAWNRTKGKVDDFVNNGAAKGNANVIAASSNEDMCKKLKKPRRVMLMVKAGQAVDDFIESLLPFLEKGDIVIDGGNSHFPDSIRRTKDLGKMGLHFIGAGVSGGEEGARYGPSIMPGGADAAWESVRPIFQAISAKVGSEPCCDWVGQDGAGHYVKMVHNGIEYGDMQVICEVYHIMRDVLKLSNKEMAEIFDEYNKGDLESYLIEITAEILAFEENGESLVDKIKDTAGQKGTGKWTAVEALELGVPLTLIGESVMSRCLSAMKDERVRASKILTANATKSFEGDKKDFVKKLGKALLAAKIVSYAQGFMLLRSAAAEHNWTLNYGGVALMWRGGCIIRSTFLGKIKEAFDANPKLESLLVNDWFKAKIAECEAGWREVVTVAIAGGIACPTLCTALNFWDGYRTEKLPANLLQAQRDYFGAHSYELLDKPGQFVHTNWTGKGGNIASSSYNA
ncbi:6-phosphogluconate dehydrogenase [Diplonema papillatum]|nr:6-phosphogluconate dehydrogenase [Diplonema papillatum]|eukprot:gene13217-20423_t